MSVQAYRLRPWNEVVRPHADILEGSLEMSTYAADLGAVDRGDENTPRVYRDAREFFRTTYMTENLRRLLADVLGAVAGGQGDRVLQLRTPFGGGKTHALLALYHLIRARKEIDADLDGIPDPGPGRVVVLSGLDLDPLAPREVDGVTLRTLWGELAFRIGGQTAYEKVRAHDESGQAPSGNVLRPLLDVGPLLILLDEVLVYVQRAAGRSGEDPRRRQVMIFLQALTEVVRGLPKTAMVYSLQASVHEAAGDEMLLGELDHLVARVDAKREPVSDEEVMRVVQRRLFPSFGEDEGHLAVARETAREYAIQFRRLREAYAETEAERRMAQAESERLEARILQSYPFHPHLLDLMYHRWGSLPSYQRTRGALQFLARVVHALWTGEGPAQPLIGPGEVVLADEHVRGAFFSQVGERESYTSVLSADITGPEARVRDVDRRIATDSPAYEQLRVGTRCASAIMLYSFGGRSGEDRGVLESELVQALVAPELDRNVITTCLHDLRDELLYLHYTGRRYRFEPKPNLNLMIQESAQGFEADEVLTRIKAELGELLKPAGDRAVLWPPDIAAIPDGDPLFRIVYLPPEASEGSSEYAEHVIDERTRVYKNALAFAEPSRAGLERARTLARHVLALDSLLGEVKAKRLTADREQLDELEERRRANAAELGATCDRLYERVLVPLADRESQRAFRLEAIDLRAQLAAGRDLHTRLLDGLRKHVFDTLTPARIVTLAKLGDTREYVVAEELSKWFFSIFDFPKLTDESVLRDAIALGTDALLGYVSGAQVVDGELDVTRLELVRFGAATNVDEIDLGPGCFVVSASLAAKFSGETQAEEADEGAGDVPLEDKPVPAIDTTNGGAQRYAVSFEATAAQLFRVLPALQNLADRSAEFRARLEVEAEGREPFDPNWLRNAVEEHFDEAGIDRD
jgi:Protein of unknown function (DUF499)